MKKELILTFITQMSIMVIGLLLYRFALRSLGDNGFAEYALSRRIISLMLPVCYLGLSVGMPRYMAINVTDKKAADSFFISGTLVFISVAMIFAAILNAAPGTFSAVFLGNVDLKYLIFPISLMLTANIIHTVCYSYFRGNMNMSKANFINLLNLGGAQAAAFMFASDVKSLLNITAIMMMASALTVLTYIMLTQIKHYSIEKKYLKELLHYGIQRLPGDFGMAALLALPAIITAHMSDLITAGNVAFGITLLNMCGAVFAPIGLVLLPKISQLIARKEYAKMNIYIKKLMVVTGLLTIAGFIIYELFAKYILAIYLGSADEARVLLTRIIMLAVLGHTFYVSQRSVIDAYFFKSYNTRNILIALLIFAALAFALHFAGNFYYIVGAFVISEWILAGMSVLVVTRIIKENVTKSTQSI